MSARKTALENAQDDIVWDAFSRSGLTIRLSKPAFKSNECAHCKAPGVGAAVFCVECRVRCAGLKWSGK